jgi:hypothetical protein
VRRLCGDPSDMLSEAFVWFCAGRCDKFLKRSWWNPPQQDLALRSCRSSMLVFVGSSFWNVYSKFLPEHLVNSSIWTLDLHRRGFPAAVAMISNFTCYCSIACLYRYIHSLPTPHTVWIRLGPLADVFFWFVSMSVSMFLYFWCCAVFKKCFVIILC